MLVFPDIDPIALQLGPIAVRWYALAYLAAFICGWRLALGYAASMPVHIKSAPSRRDFDDFLTWAILGVIIGGRLGYILFYDLARYLEQPAEIYKVWHGGMSFHGGLLGMMAAFGLFCWQRRLNWRAFGDVLAIITPLGLFFGRLANFVNGELYGRITNVPWGMVFPGGGENPRHPSQLYQAFGEGLLLFIIMVLCARVRAFRGRPGMLGGIFLVGYALLRALAENYRSPDPHLGFVYQHLTMGQVLCLPMALAGLALIVISARQHLPALSAAPSNATPPRDDQQQPAA